MLYPIIPQAEIEMVFLVSQFMGNKCIVEEEKLKKFNKSNIKKLRRAHTREREKSKVSQDLEDALSSPSRNKGTEMHRVSLRRSQSTTISGSPPSHLRNAKFKCGMGPPFFIILFN